MLNADNLNENVFFFKKLVAQFLVYKRALGYKYQSEEASLNRFIKFSADFGLTEADQVELLCHEVSCAV